MLLSVLVTQVSGHAPVALRLGAAVLLPWFFTFTPLDVGMSHLCVSVEIQSFRVFTHQERSSSGG